jgi:hypothetical protein
MKVPPHPGKKTTANSRSGCLSLPEQMTFGTDGYLHIARCDTNELPRHNGTTGAFIDGFVSAGLGGVPQTTGRAFGSNRNLHVASHHDAVKTGSTGTLPPERES